MSDDGSHRAAAASNPAAEIQDSARPQLEIQGIQHTSLRSQALRIIRAQIASGALVPGQLYAIGDIASKLGVSPTPVREALLDLARERLVEIVRNRGFRIVALSDEDLDQIVELRIMLEVPPVKQLAARSEPPDLSGLRPLSKQVEAAAAAGDLVTFLSLDRDLHMAILNEFGNPRLVEIVGNLRDQTRLYGLWNLVGSEDLVETAREHDAILDAIEAGEPETAEQLLTRHLRHTRGLWAGRKEGASA